ncbi:MAG: KH domain-containing protein [Desulfovibrionaceae bacterium]|nr:KH domain-containing protein [Desulfovibrionaceae bacterium]
MKDVLAEIARSLVDHPDQVVVTETPSRGGVLLQLAVAREDRGKLIGKQGRTVRALRTLVHAASLKTGTHMALEVSK